MSSSLQSLKGSHEFSFQKCQTVPKIKNLQEPSRMWRESGSQPFLESRVRVEGQSHSIYQLMHESKKLLHMWGDTFVSRGLRLKIFSSPPEFKKQEVSQKAETKQGRKPNRTEHVTRWLLTFCVFQTLNEIGLQSQSRPYGLICQC